MNITITPAELKGAIAPPPSKSQAHRLIIAAALAKGTSVLSNVAFSQDILATLNCMAALGAAWTDLGGGRLSITGLGGLRHRGAELPRLDCGESGSTLRFLIPIALAVAGGGVFTGRGRLMDRPQQPYEDLCREKGIRWQRRGNELTVEGTLTPGEYRLAGNVSSQFFTGLLYALPLLDGPSRVVSTTELESWDYVAMTVAAQAKFDVPIILETEGTFDVQPRLGRAARQAVERDWSQAGFWYGARALGCRVDIREMDPTSVQGDRCVAWQYEKLTGPGEVTLDVSQCPDLVPPLAAMAALRAGEVTHLVNAARLRMKESDRLATVTAALNALGARVEEGADSLTIRGLDALEGGAEVSACNDHRIAMMLAVAAIRCRRPVKILGAECVAKSYPDFWEDYERLGGKLAREE